MLVETRQYENTLFYHVYNRGVNKQTIFLDDQDRWYFLKLCKKATRKYNVTLLAFCLMGNHYHLFVRANSSDLSRSMKYIGEKYSKYFIRKYQDLKKNGHTFMGPYGRKIVQDDLYGTHLLSYIHLNPYKDGFVKHPSQYFWSSYNLYDGKKDHFGFIEKSTLLDKFQSFPTLDSGETFIEEGTLNWDPNDFIIRGDVLGDVDFAQTIYGPGISTERIRLSFTNKTFIQSKDMMNFIKDLRLEPRLHNKILSYCLLEWTELNSSDLEELLNTKSGSLRQGKHRVKNELQAGEGITNEIIQNIKQNFSLL